MKNNLKGKLKICVLLLVSSTLLSCLKFQTKNEVIDNENIIGIQNKLLSITFDKQTGTLVSLINKTTNDDYIKNPDGGNLFRLFINTKSMPRLRAGAQDSNYGGILIDPKSCELRSHTIVEGDLSKTLSLIYNHEQSKAQIELTIDLFDNSDTFDTHLSVKNIGEESFSIYTAFPYLTGVCLGEDKRTNLAVNMWDRGYPAAKAWDKPLGGVYGKSVAMQWQSVYEPKEENGFAFITLDSNFENKILTTFPDGGMASLYFDQKILASGQIQDWPSARLIAYSGNWRTAARSYKNWFDKNVSTRKVPNWYKEEVATRSSTWLPTMEIVAENKRIGNPDLFTSFEQLHDLFGRPIFGNNYNDCMEIAMWNEGVNLWPETYGPWMSSGFIDFRSDLGGVEAFKKGIEICHKYGRKVAMYVAAYGARKESPFFKGDWERFAIKDKQGKAVMDYKKGKEEYGAFNCPGYKPWQDNLIRVCKMLVNAGVDEIRLDEFGFPFRPCFNEVHGHENPYNSNKWMRECLKRIRQSTDEINPDFVISTEFFMDYFNESTNGALVMDCPGSEIDAMKVAMPNYLPLSYHASASEAAITGAIMSKTSSKRNNWAWGNVGVEKPQDYDENFEINLNWHKLYPTFAKAVTYGDITEWDPFAINDKRWMGHVWKSENFWALTGGHIDATPLSTDQVVIQLPELPEAIQKGYEFNVETLELREVPITRQNGVIKISLESAVSAVLFPLPNCPALPLIGQNKETVKRGGEIIITVLPIAHWKDNSNVIVLENVDLVAPGFKVKKEISGSKVVFTISIENDTPINNFHYTISGDCLKGKRWFQVVE